MIGYILLACVILFVTYCLGLVSGYTMGYRIGVEEINKTIEWLAETASTAKGRDSNDIIRPSESSDREAP